MPHVNDADESRDGRQFKKMPAKGVTFNVCRKGDSCCLLEDSKLVVITNIIRSG